MGPKVKSYSGPDHFRWRLVLSVLSSQPISIKSIRVDEESPGLTSAEASFVKLLDQLTNGSHVEINEIGTALFFRPGILIGGSLRHDCGSADGQGRAVGWYIEGLLPLACFAKSPVRILFENCITNDDMDPSVDMIRDVMLPLVRQFGVGADEESQSQLFVNVKARGARPKGGGVVDFSCPIARTLRTIDLCDAGLVRKVRGTAYSTKLSPQVPNRMVHAARATLNHLLPDVFIFTDVYSGKTSGASPGFAVMLTASTTTGCTISAEATAETAALPEDVAQRAVSHLLEEVWDGGCIDSTHQSIALTLMALGPEDVSRIRTGNLTESAMGTLRLLRDFFGVVFKVRSDPENETVSLSCLGSGFKNAARRVT
uniref:RNA 3'-terminal-phosphate cyclase (ATP) n=1 Tax=Rhizochromulina marina TaxID=1034831 RepID=A0A7S2SWC6_9STRA